MKPAADLIETINAIVYYLRALFGLTRGRRIKKGLVYSGLIPLHVKNINYYEESKDIRNSGTVMQ
jgi:hypothetical protein